MSRIKLIEEIGSKRARAWYQREFSSIPCDGSIRSFSEFELVASIALGKIINVELFPKFWSVL